MVSPKNQDDDFYAYTQTFSGIPHNLSAKGQFKRYYRDVISALEKSTEFELFPEWRMTTGEIHFHGTLYIKDKIKWIKQTMPFLKRLGFIKIIKIKDLQGWLEYCQKESKIACEILGLNVPFKNGALKHVKPIVEIIDDEIIKTNICQCIECLIEKKTKI